MVKNFDTNEPVNAPDTRMQIYFSGQNNTNATDKEAILHALCQQWSRFSDRFNTTEDDWVSGLSGHLKEIMEMRANHVQRWISQNLERFKAAHANLETLRRACDIALAELKENVHLCKAQCASCNLLCLQSHGHDTQHDCGTSHLCHHLCGFYSEHPSEEKKCGFRYVKLYKCFILLTPSQCWTFRGTCVCQGIFCDISILTDPTP